MLGGGEVLTARAARASGARAPRVVTGRRLATQQPNPQPIQTRQPNANGANDITIKRQTQALILNVIDPKIGGVMIMGDRGTGKSTTIRALADLLPEMRVVDKDPFNSGAFNSWCCWQCGGGPLHGGGRPAGRGAEARTACCPPRGPHHPEPRAPRVARIRTCLHTTNHAHNATTTTPINCTPNYIKQTPTTPSSCPRRSATASRRASR